MPARRSRRRSGESPALPDGRPAVVAHRGSSELKAEHTLGAYVAALEEGADALECDVRLTADGHLICAHDRDLRRTGSSDGLISTTDLASLDQLDFARWKEDPLPASQRGPWQPPPHGGVELARLDEEQDDLDKVLPLRRLLETVADYPRRVELAIETKHPTRFGGLVEKRLVDLLDDFGWAGVDSPVRVMSFSWVALRRVERLAPDLDVVFLLDSPGEWYRARPLAGRHWIAGPGIKVLRKHPDAVRRIGRSARLHCWVVNTEEDVELCADLGVEALISDRPGQILRYLERDGAGPAPGP
ncbi:glycerophosphoryl diester phosphodiesterase [Marmoricola endophyticus]|uniref:Glycerophosphoryl diester phosphodiesterase n=1 Tax=Marmoricola endophyticus TaxID=2040280 RepID=A0A917F317_9ACTN|nr:glycerophosphodiester phosphodiesterase family protein [Marmoricola endophyticus]GGF47849.1 glycerophosphoryl diester phosphodiesterase [Marmoricola endophyticus]